MTQARIAVVGCGSWSTEAHLPALAANPDAKVIAVADSDRAAAEQAARRFGIDAVYSSHEELLAAERPDGVVIATPHARHYLHARAALEQGAHILVEKPMVLDPAQARELTQLAATRGRQLIVGYPWHYNRQALQLRDLVRAGELGTLEFVSSQFASMVREYYRGDTEAYQPELQLARPPRSETYSDPTLSGGGQGQTQVTHSAALLFWLTGLRPRRVAAFCEGFDLAVDLVDSASISFFGGALGTIASTGDRPGGHQDILILQLSGTKGLATFDVMEGAATIYQPGGRVDRLDALPLAERYPHWGPAQNLVDVVLGRAPNKSPAEVGSVTVEFLAAMYRSAAADGQPIDLPPNG
jgi:predicted dehydrogenase